MIDYNYFTWLTEADEVNAPTAAQAPGGEPQSLNPQPPTTVPGQENPSPQPGSDEPPELPDQEIKGKDKAKDFDSWKYEFLKLAVHGDQGKMIDMIGLVRHLPGLQISQKKYVEDNLAILQYRQEANIDKASKEIRRQIAEGIDRTNPGSSIMQIVTSVLEKDVLTGEILQKLCGMYGSKGEYHRKFLAALTGAVQQGGAGNHADLLFCGDDKYTVNISTRITGEFGEIKLGKWFLKEGDPEKYLAPAEQDRLESGSPEEKQVLRRRVIMESICEKFKKRSFLIHVVSVDGTVHSIGWDLGESLAGAYRDGNVIVRAKTGEERNAVISEDGKIIPLLDVEIAYVMETGELDEDGNVQSREVPFMERRDGHLYLVCDLSTMKKAAPGLSGMFFREVPYAGNPGELTAMRQCVVNLAEILNKRCFK